MNQREADLIEQMTQIGLRLAELTAENKILKSVNDRLLQALPIHGVMQAASASVSEAAVASEGRGEANTCADAGCPQCKNTDVYDIDDHWTKCNNCGFTFVG